METLQKQYQTTLAKELQEKLALKNTMATPRLTKIVVNMGVKDVIADKKRLIQAREALEKITGQKPKTTKAKKSIATFKLREGEEIGLVVTLRGKRMYDFFDKLVKIVFPRIRDFHGLKRTSFDGRGNYALGFTEYSVFPEIDLGQVERVQGMEIIMVTSAPTDAQALILLEALGMRFMKETTA